MKAICPPGSSSSFFQLSDLWDYWKNSAIRDVVKAQEDNAVLRVWVTPCSSGEWCYSLAIAFQEVISELRANVRLQIIATDVDQERILLAEKGFYPSYKVISLCPKWNGVSPRRRRQFFNEIGEGYQIKDELRQMIEFSRHDLVDDPPYTGISFIFCTWLIQWLNDQDQKKMIRNLFDSLVPGGVLLLNYTLFYRKDKFLNLY